MAQRFDTVWVHNLNQYGLIITEKFYLKYVRIISLSLMLNYKQNKKKVSEMLHIAQGADDITLTLIVSKLKKKKPL